MCLKGMISPLKVGDAFNNNVNLKSLRTSAKCCQSKVMQELSGQVFSNLC